MVWPLSNWVTQTVWTVSFQFNILHVSFEKLSIYFLSFIAAIKSRNQIQTQSHNATTATLLPNGTNGTHLHKLLVSGASTNLTAPIITSSIVNGTSELARLPGGAELNILPTNSNGTTLYRGNGQLAIIKGIK